MSNNVTLVGPTVFVVRVIKPSGSAIANANVAVEWEELQNPYDETPKVSNFVTDAKGEVQVPILDPKEWWIDPEGGTLGKMEVTKEFHGPIVPYGTAFKYQAAKVEFRVKAKGDKQISLGRATDPIHTFWGRPRALYKTGRPAVIEVTMMEGGELGKEHASVRTRRLSAPHRPTVPPSKISQIDEELLFHIAHGGLAPDPATDYKFKVIAPPAGSGGASTLELDQPAPPTGQIPNVPRITARNSIVGGLRFMHLLQFVGKDKIRVSGEAGMNRLNPRLMVGAIRLARRLVATNKDLKVVLTSGFGRNKDDAHGNGRAIDFGGLIAADVPGLVDPNFPEINDPRDPNCIKKTKPDWQTVTVSSGQSATAYEKACVAETDFVVLYHWGMVKLLVETGTGRVRRAEDGGSYKNDFSPNSATESLVYRLSEVPKEADRHPNHKLTDKHYEMTRDLFGAVYAFFAQEFAHRDTYLGPPSAHNQLNLVTQTTALAAVVADDAGGAPLTPGPVQGFVLHPDYPAPDAKDATGAVTAPKRQTHANHVHANLGVVRPPGSPPSVLSDFER